MLIRGIFTLTFLKEPRVKTPVNFPSVLFKEIFTKLTENRGRVDVP